MKLILLVALLACLVSFSQVRIYDKCNQHFSFNYFYCISIYKKAQEGQCGVRTAKVNYGYQSEFTHCCGDKIPYNATTERCCDSLEPFCYFTADEVNNYSCCSGSWTFNQVNNMYSCNGVYPLSGPCRYNVI